MSSPTPSTEPTPVQGTALNPKAIAALAILVVAVIFIFSNWSKVYVNFLFITIEVLGWILYTLLFAGGAAVGFYLGRNRYKRKS